MNPILRSIALCVLACAASVTFAAPTRAEELPAELVGVGVEEHLGDQVDLNLRVTDHLGRNVRLGELIRGDIPVLLTLNYYGCPMLCGVQLNFLSDMLRELDWTAGKEFRIVTVSFNPEEGTELAAAKRKNQLKALGHGEIDWTFATADSGAIAALARTVGYNFKYLPETKEFAHPAVIMFLSPVGKISRYVYGLTYLPRDIKFALIEASNGRVGSSVDKIIMSCFHYDPSRGSYVPFAWGIMRLGAALSVLLLASVIVVFRRREIAAATA